MLICSNTAQFRSIGRFVWPTFAACVCLLWLAPATLAGTITGMSVSQGSTETTTTTTYTFTFTPATTISGSGDGRYIWINFDDDYTVGSAVLESITPSISGMAINNRNDSNGEIRMYSGTTSTIQGGQQYVVVLSGIQNPATPQTPVAHQIRTGDGSSTVDTGTVAAAPITAAATNPPVVDTPIPDKVDLEESQGQIQYIANLNDHFFDGDGDTITYSASSSDGTVVAVSLSGTNNRTLSLQAHKFGSANITVTGTTSDGTVDDVFNVTTIGLLTGTGVAQGSTETSATANFSFTFTPETTINSGNWSDGAYFFFNFDDDFNISGASLGSVSPSITGMSLTGTNLSNNEITLRTTTGAITGAQSYTVVLNGIQNPPAAQTPDAHEVTTGQGSGTVDKASIAAAAIVTAATNPPVITSPITDQELAAEDGAQVVVADLNTVFTDGDGDPMTFSIVAGHDTSIASASINSSQLTVTPVGTGTTSITVEASATDGQETDTFDVKVLGLLTPADVQPASLAVGATGEVVVTFTPSTNVISSDWIVVGYPSGFDGDSATLGTVSPATATLNLFSNASSSVMQLTSGMFSQGASVSITLGDVTNPNAAGNPGDYTIWTQDSSNSPYAKATIPGDAFGHNLNDFDGDGNAELVWRNGANGMNSLWYMNGSVRTAVEAIISVTDLNWTIVGTGDLDEDNDADILWRNTFTGVNAVWYMNGGNRTGVATLDRVRDTTWEIVSVADLDSDGDSDILWYHPISGKLVIWYMTGIAMDSIVTFDQVRDTRWRPEGMGDFDGDGDPDLVWRNSQTGANVVWFLDAGVRTAINVIDDVRNTDWRIVAVGDLDGDGDADLVWRSPTGKNVVWTMDGLTRSSINETNQVVSTDWDIQAPN